MNLSNIQIDTQNEVSEGLPSKVEIDIEKSILNSILDNKEMETLRRLGERLKRAYRENGLDPYVVIYNSQNEIVYVDGDYKWQDDCAAI